MDVTNLANRKEIIQEILGDENRSRKEDHFKRYEIYRDRQHRFVEEALLKEFSEQTVQEMRKVSSINLGKRIIDEMSNVYKNEPVRTFSTRSGQDIAGATLEQCENIYKYSKANVKYKKANKWYELHGQCAIQVIPKNGVIDLRVLAPHQYDVVTSDSDPEKAQAYVINTLDRGRYLSSIGSGNQSISNPSRGGGSSSFSDGTNQKIGDADDYKKSQMRFVWWTSELNFITDGNAAVIIDDKPVLFPDFEQLTHDLGELPFEDVASDKDFEFWVRASSGATQFSIEFLTLMSDVFNIHKMQGFAQAIVYSEKPPVNMRIGTNHVLHLPIDPNKEIQPRFEFANPNPDMQASLTLLENFLRMYLTSKGIDPRSVSGSGNALTYASGIERLLAMIEKFETSKDSYDLFKSVEDRVFEKVKRWSNLMQTASVASETTEPLIPELRLSQIPEDTMLTVNFHGPEIVQTVSEREDSSIKLIEAGLMSRLEGIQFIRNIDENKAAKVIENIDLENFEMTSSREEDPVNVGKI